MRDALLVILSLYSLVGCCFAPWFCLVAHRAAAKPIVRCLWMPGAAAIWPLLAWQRLRGHAA